MAKVRREQLAALNTIYRLYPFEEFLKTQASLGASSIELWAGAPHFLLGWEGYSDCLPLKAQIEGYGLKVGAFCPECVIYPFTLCAPDTEMHRKSMEYFKNGIRAAAELGAPVMTVGCAGGLIDVGREAALRRAAESLKELGSFAEEKGVTIAVETLTPSESIIVNTLPELLELLAEVNCSSVKACLDICAARSAGESIEQWFEAFGEDLVHIHFSDGRPGGRLVWGQGLHPVDDYLQTIADCGYKGLLGLNINLRGNWFDPSLLSEEKGFTGEAFYPQNYWFNPAGADRANFEALKPWLGDEAAAESCSACKAPASEA